jgi:hypothetical protein
MNRYGTADIIYSGDGALSEAFGRWVKWEDANAEITRLRETLEWFRDFYIGVVHDADHDRKAHKKIVEALGGDK